MATDAMTRSSGGEGAPTPSAWKALAGAAYRPYWLDDPGRPAPAPPSSGRRSVICSSSAAATADCGPP
ncbi:hypothetical protein ACFQ10_36340 [Streptomyces indonesiensis]